MSSSSTPPRSGAAPRNYLVISPVKDEARFVGQTLRSVAAQTVRAVRWVIVDDGSVDETPRILHQFAQRHAWITIVTRQDRAARRPGSPVMQAFYSGLENVGDAPYDYIVKLDCDVDLPPDYFERLIEHFERDPALGIASGVYLEEATKGWRAIGMPPYHAAGASKFMRRRCFEEIDGFVRARGWDTVDEIRAQAKGWTTRHFDDLRFKHLKPEGSGIGSLRTNVLHGDVYYLTGGGPGFLLLKVAHRMLFGAPPLVGGLALLWGYLRCLARGRERLVTHDEARHYRRLLARRLPRLPIPRSRGSRSAAMERY